MLGEMVWGIYFFLLKKTLIYTTEDLYVQLRPQNLLEHSTLEMFA